MCVARLPAPPDHRADLRGEGEAVTVPLWAQPRLLSPHSGAAGRRGQNTTAREELSRGEAEAGAEGEAEAGAERTPSTWYFISKSAMTLGKTSLPGVSASPSLKWG